MTKLALKMSSKLPLSSVTITQLPDLTSPQNFQKTCKIYQRKRTNSFIAIPRFLRKILKKKQGVHPRRQYIDVRR